MNENSNGWLIGLIAIALALVGAAIYDAKKPPEIQWDTARVMKFYDGQSDRVDVDLSDGSKMTFVYDHHTAAWHKYPSAEVVTRTISQEIQKVFVRKRWGTDNGQ